MTRCLRSPLVPLVFFLGGAALNAADRDWPVYLGDAGATHYSTLSLIEPANVARLQRVWEFHTGDAPAGNRSQIQCNPLIVDGVLYGTSPQLKLLALDAATGKERWRFNPFSNSDEE